MSLRNDFGTPFVESRGPAEVGLAKYSLPLPFFNPCLRHASLPVVAHARLFGAPGLSGLW